MPDGHEAGRQGTLQHADLNRLSNGECNFTLYGVFSDLRYSFFFFLFDQSVMAVGAFGS